MFRSFDIESSCWSDFRVGPGCVRKQPSGCLGSRNFVSNFNSARNGPTLFLFAVFPWNWGSWQFSTIPTWIPLTLFPIQRLVLPRYNACYQGRTISGRARWQRGRDLDENLWVVPGTKWSLRHKTVLSNEWDCGRFFFPWRSFWAHGSWSQIRLFKLAKQFASQKLARGLERPEQQLSEGAFFLVNRVAEPWHGRVLRLFFRRGNSAWSGGARKKNNNAGNERLNTRGSSTKDNGADSVDPWVRTERVPWSAIHFGFT